MSSANWSRRDGLLAGRCGLRVFGELLVPRSDILVSPLNIIYHMVDLVFIIFHIEFIDSCNISQNVELI